jgi:hypothetical protein
MKTLAGFIVGVCALAFCLTAQAENEHGSSNWATDASPYNSSPNRSCSDTDFKIPPFFRLRRQLAHRTTNSSAPSKEHSMVGAMLLSSRGLTQTAMHE